MNRTEELREKIAQLEDVLHSKYYHRKYGYHRWDDLPPIMRNEIYSNATQILEACDKAGLAFVVEDVQLPENTFNPEKHSGTLNQCIIEGKRLGYEIAQQKMLEAGFKMWKEIELT